MPVFQFAWATGWDVPLVSLSNVEDDLRPYAQLRVIAPQATLVESLPVRAIALSGEEQGEGTLVFQWRFSGMPKAAFQYILSSKYTVGGVLVASRMMTVYTRADDLTFVRYNVYAAKPIAGREYTLRQGKTVVDTLIRFVVDEVL